MRIESIRRFDISPFRARSTRIRLFSFSNRLDFPKCLIKCALSPSGDSTLALFGLRLMLASTRFEPSSSQLQLRENFKFTHQMIRIMPILGTNLHFPKLNSDQNIKQVNFYTFSPVNKDN